MVDAVVAPIEPRPAEPEPAETAKTAERGQHGRLIVRAELIAGRTRLTDVQQRPPLQVLRATYPDAAMPDLAAITIVSPAGGVLQGDVLEMEIRVAAGARLSVGTQSATRIYRAPRMGAVMSTTLHVEPAAYLEFVPDPIIPYAGSRLRATTTCLVAGGGTLILGEALTGGRLARGERFGLDRFESLVEIRRPDGDLVVRDAVMLGGDASAARLGRLGRHLAMGTLYVVRAGFEALTLREAIDPSIAPDIAVGASDLPNGAGAWLRVLGPDARSVLAVLRAGWASARRHILGFEPPIDRRP
jgi:urease accessory protein